MISVDLVFTALSDPTRRKLLATLAEQGNASASGLANTSNISRQAIAKHLVALENAGLVTRHKLGKEMVFAAEPSQLAATGRWLQRTADRWQQPN